MMPVETVGSERRDLPPRRRRLPQSEPASRRRCRPARGSPILASGSVTSLRAKNHLTGRPVTVMRGTRRNMTHKPPLSRRIVIRWFAHFGLVVLLPLRVLLPLASAEDKPPATPRALGKEDAVRLEALRQEIGRLCDAGEFARAVDPAGRVLTITETALGPGDWRTADARRAIGTLRQIAGLPIEGQKAMAAVGVQLRRILEMSDKADFTGPEGIARELFATRERWLGAEHPDTASSCQYLASILYARGKYADARDLHQKSLAIRLKALGPDHPETAQSYQGIAIALLSQGDLGGADPLLRKSLAIRLKALGPDHPDTGDTYNSLAFNSYSQARHVEAGSLYQKALAIYLKSWGEDHHKTATIYNNLAVNLNAQGKYVEAEPYFRKALAISLKTLGEDHRWTALSTYGLGMNLFNQGKYDESERLLRRALTIREKALGPDHPETGQIYHSLASLLVGRGKYAEAEPLSRKALEICLKAVGPDHPETAWSYFILAVSLYDQDRYEEAEPLHQKALAIRLKVLGPDHTETAQSYTSIATNLGAQGRSAEAESYFRKALDVFRRTLGAEHHLTAGGYGNVAASLVAQGRWAEAEPPAQQSLAIELKALGADHPETAVAYDNLANILAAQGKWAEAEQLTRKALDIVLRTLGTDHPDTAISYLSLAGHVYAQRKYAEDEALARRALAIYHKVSGTNSARIADAYFHLAASLHAQRRYAEAEAHLRQSLDIRLKVLGAHQADTVECYHNMAMIEYSRGRLAEAEALARKELAIYLKAPTADDDQIARMYNQLGFIVDARGRPDEAIHFWKEAVDGPPARRSPAGLSGLERALRPGVSPGSALAVALARQGRAREAWERWEAQLARGLLDDLSARQLRPLTADERRREADLIGQLQAFDEQIGKLVAKSAPTQDDEKRLELLRQRQRSLRGQYVALESELSARYREFAGTPATLAEVRSALPDDAALVGWVDLEPEGPPPDPDHPPHHWACVVRRDGDPHWVQISGTGPGRTWTPEDDRRPEALRDALRRNAPTWRELAAALANQRLEPLRPHLAGITHLIVLPSRSMAGIPVDTLFEAGPSGATRPMVSDAPSATMFVRLSRPRTGPALLPRLLALGDPAYPVPVPEAAPPQPPDHGIALLKVERNGLADLAGLREGDVLLQYNGTELKGAGDLKTVPAEAGARSIPIRYWRRGEVRTATVAAGELGIGHQPGRKAAEFVLARRASDEILHLSTRGMRLERLSGSRREVEWIAAMFPDDRATILLGEQATESALQRMASNGDLKSYRFVHLATHGEADLNIAMGSTIFLAPDPDRPADPTSREADGRISAQQIVNTWDLDADLVVLSACESGLGRYAGGEGYLGFTQALFVKGARTVVLAQWKVSDRVTAPLIRRFYENLLGKRPDLTGPMPKARALDEAKRWLRGLDAAQAERVLIGADPTRGPVRELKTVPAPNSSRPFAHPYYWAGFVLVGDPN